MLELDNATATIKHVSLRCEKHGPEEVPAADLKIETKQSNHILSFFGSQLLDSLYWREGGDAVNRYAAALLLALMRSRC